MLPPKPVYLPFGDAQWRLKLGLKPLKLEDWIEIDEEFTQYLTLKTELLQQHHAKVFDSLPSSLEAQQEVLDLLLAHLPERFPDYYRRQGNFIHNLLTEQVWDISDFAANPLDLAGRLVQEDLCILQSSPEGYILTAGSVCLPFHWWFPDKLGKSVTQMHQRVPSYGEKLEHPVNNFFDRLRFTHPGYRLNWAMMDNPQLCLAVQENSISPNEPITVENIGQTLWIRVERQTLRRLEKSHGILFTIRTYLYPLAILESKPAMAHGFLAEMQQLPPSMQHFKELTTIQTALVAYLEKISPHSTSCL
ncbi:DUF3445 domain-containing protein [Phormidium tenue FACHB-886]|nr:DUF3445 domain-containing protein [Phormidium tenue FACHB-886]